MKRVSVRLVDSSFDLIPLIAHDLRTPITAIKGLTQLALRRTQPPSVASPYLTAVVDEANQIAAIVDDLVLFQRLEGGEAKVLPTRVDLRALLRELSTGSSVLDGAPRPVVAPGGQPVFVECDPVILSRAVLHLVKIATQHAGDDGRVSLGVREIRRGAEIWIAPLPDQETASGPNLGPRLGPGDLVEAGGAESFSAASLSLILATKLVEAQGGQILWDESSAFGAGFHVILPEARGS
jgi:K+-sensing histidine kinase KdpD